MLRAQGPGLLEIACKALVLLAFKRIADRLFLQRSWRDVPHSSLGLDG